MNRESLEIYGKMLLAWMEHLGSHGKEEQKSQCPCCTTLSLYMLKDGKSFEGKWIEY